MTEFTCNSLKETQTAAEYFSQFAKPGQCFALSGNLGAGKTTFSKYLIQSLTESSQEVTSPTFPIVQTYEAKIAEIWHVDCHRLKSEDEIYELGLEEAFHRCITIIEWPEIIQRLLPANAMKIHFHWDGKTRKISF